MTQKLTRHQPIREYHVDGLTPDQIKEHDAFFETVVDWVTDGMMGPDFDGPADLGRCVARVAIEVMERAMATRESCQSFDPDVVLYCFREFVNEGE